MSILRDEIKEFLNNLNDEEILKTYKDGKDYIKLTNHVFNPGGYGTIEGVDYDEEDETETIDNGDIYTDVDNFSNLVRESQTTNKVLLTFYS